MDGRTRELYGEFADEGVEVLSCTQSRGSTHVKIRCRFLGHEFVYVASLNSEDSNRALKNRRADLRRIKRAIRKGDQTVLSKFKVRRSSP
jgi:hypothetical protein